MKSIENDFYRFSRIAMEKSRHGLYTTFLILNMKGIAKFLGVKYMRDDVHEFFMTMAKSTIEYRKKNNVQRNDFVDLLMKLEADEDSNDKSSGVLTPNEIAAQSFIFFLAGYETTATVIFFTVYELALNREIQIKIREDIRNALEKHGDITYEMIMDIPYLDQIIKGDCHFKQQQ